MIALVDVKPGIAEEFHTDAIEMVRKNIFRPLPVQNMVQTAKFDPTQLEPTWDHLQLVYEFLLRFVVSSDISATQLEKHINEGFLTVFLGLFNTVDPRERDYLKTTLHRTYGKSMARRRFIRKSMCETFQDFVNGTFHHNGISEL